MAMYYDPGITFYIFAFLSIAIFALGMIQKILIWRLGKGRELFKEVNKGKAVSVTLTDVIFQKQLLQKSIIRWIMHIGISWGFVGLLVHTTILFLTSHFMPVDSGFTKFFFSETGKNILDFWGDFWGLLLFGGLIIAFFRRHVIKPESVETLTYDLVSLWLLIIICITGFLAEAVRMAVYNTLSPFSFVGFFIAKLLAPMQLYESCLEYTQIFHAYICLIFVAYIPFSKLVHMMVSPVSIVLNTSTQYRKESA